MLMQTVSIFVGVDWGTVVHRVCVLNAAGQVVCSRAIEHNGKAIADFLRSVMELADGDSGRVAVAIEVPRGPLVESCLNSGFAVFAINPKQLDRFRDRHDVAGCKDDRRDAFVAASSLRTDPDCFRQVALDSAEVSRVRELSRLDESLGEDLRRTVNQLYQLLVSYYPQLLRLCPTPDEPWVWALLESAPTPDKARKLTLGRIRAHLARWRIRRLTAEHVQEALREQALQLAPGTVEVMSEHALLLLPQLRLLDDQRRVVRDRLKTLLDTMAAAEHPSGCAVSDAAIIQSIPGVGPAITAALLAEASDAIRNRDYYALRAYGGTAPITRQSGKTRQVSMRRGCNRRVRNALYQWARCSILYDPRSRDHYDRLRQAGHDYSRALRGVADRLLAMLVAMLRKHELYSVSNRLAAQTAAQ